MKIKRKGSTTYISKEYKGPIEELPFKEYIKDLNKWAKKKKAKPYGKPVAFYLKDFKEGSDENFRADIAKPIKIRRKAGGGYKMKFNPPMQVASKKFKGTPSEYPEAYTEIYEYIKEKGYMPYYQRMEKFKDIPKKEEGQWKINSILEVPVKIPTAYDRKGWEKKKRK